MFRVQKKLKICLRRRYVPWKLVKWTEQIMHHKRVIFETTVDSRYLDLAYLE